MKGGLTSSKRLNLSEPEKEFSVTIAEGVLSFHRHAVGIDAGN